MRADDAILGGGGGWMKRLLVPSTAVLWGLQFGFLNPTLAIIVVALYHVSTAEIGIVLAIYNAGGFISALAIPTIADRRGDYLGPMLGCGVLTIVLVVGLSLTTEPWLATALLFALGGPASTGVALLFAHLRGAGVRAQDIVRTRALVSAAWVAGPPVATLLIDRLGAESVLVAIGAIAAGSSTLVVFQLRERRRRTAPVEPVDVVIDRLEVSRPVMVVVVVAFVLLFAGNNSATSVSTLYVTRTLDAPAIWSGAALAIAAALEIPALLVMGRLGVRVPTLVLVASGCLTGAVYFVAAAFVSDPVQLLLLQPLNAWRVAAISGMGMALFQRMIRLPGLATGIFLNTQRGGAVLSGAVITFGSASPWGERGIFGLCGALCVVAMFVVGTLARRLR